MIKKDQKLSYKNGWEMRREDARLDLYHNNVLVETFFNVLVLQDFIDFLGHARDGRVDQEGEK